MTTHTDQGRSRGNSLEELLTPPSSSTASGSPVIVDPSVEIVADVTIDASGLHCLAGCHRRPHPLSSRMILPSPSRTLRNSRASLTAAGRRRPAESRRSSRCRRPVRRRPMAQSSAAAANWRVQKPSLTSRCGAESAPGNPTEALDEQIAEGAVGLQSLHVRLRSDVSRHR